MQNISLETFEKENNGNAVFRTYEPDKKECKIPKMSGRLECNFSGAIVQKSKSDKNKGNVTNYISKYMDDGSSKDIYICFDGVSYEIIFDNKNKEIGGTLSNGTKFKTIMDRGGFKRVYTTIDFLSYEYYFNMKGIEFGGITSYGDTFVTKFLENGTVLRLYTDSDNKKYQYEFDENGKVVSYIDERLQYLRTYNSDGSYQNEYRNVDGSTYVYVYDKFDRQIFYSDENLSYTTVYKQNSSSYTEKYNRTDGTVYEYEYDEYERIVSYNDVNNAYRKIYDDAGECAVVWHDGSIYTYDKYGKELGGILNNGTTFNTKYNNNGYIRTFTKIDGSKYEYEFDEKGKIIQFKDNSNLSEANNIIDYVDNAIETVDFSVEALIY